MNDENTGSLGTLAQDKLDADNDFNETLVDMSDEDKETAVSEKKSEIINQLYSDLGVKSTKNEELAKNYKIRAEKAEGDKKPKEGDETPKNKEDNKETLSSTDLYSLIDAKVPQEDVEEVIKASKLLGKSISEALQDDTVKVILEKRTEHRATAKATNTTTARQSNKKTSDSELIAKADKGEFPEKGSPEAEQLFWARKGGKRE